MDNIDDIILKSLNHSANTEELEQLEAWLSASKYNEHVYKELLNAWSQGKKTDYNRVSNIWNKYQEKAEIGKEAESLSPPFRPKRLYSRRNWSIAASISVLIALGLSVFFISERNSRIIYQTAFGEKMEVVLADQSEITLNANSRLWHYKGKPREVWLDGEAFFHVSKKPESGAKFTVLTSDLEVEVLGTSFNVNSLKQKTDVFLEEGKVKLHLKGKQKDKIELIPGDLLSYSANKAGSLTKRRNTSQNLTSWKDGAIILEMVAVSKVLDEMERIYGISIQLKDKRILNKEIMLAIPIENRSIALSALENVLGRKIKQTRDNEYLIE
ncbi:MAG: FecR domain-containing protein [Bacteroidia bacterium]|nr:FecR domain-containing protein [Bacteroidia bacterium]